MLSIDFIRNNKQKVIDGAKNKNRAVDIESILTLDEERKELSGAAQKLREDRNSVAKEKPSDESIKRGREIKEQLKGIEDKLQHVADELSSLLMQVPNVPLDDVPIGPDDKSNQEVKNSRNKPTFDFTPKSHIDLTHDLDLADFERGAKIAGFRGYFLKGQLARLHFAVLFYAFNKLISRGYTPLIAPAITKEFTLFGNGQFPWGRQEVYQLNDDDAYLAGTAEVTVTGYFANETLNLNDMPHKFVAFSPCFRREAGSYGKDTKGLYRVHEFAKVEQLVFSENNIERALTLFDELQANTEEILQDLEIPYRVMYMSTGEMGEPQIKKYDTEAWIPSKNEYGEMASNSILGDFQARRLGIRYKDTDGETQYCFTLNNTAIASPRILIPLLENHQQRDGSITIPKALQPLVGFDKIEEKK